MTIAHRTILRIDSSGRYDTSYSRRLVNEFMDLLTAPDARADIVVRDLASNPPAFVCERWIEANFTPEEDRDSAQKSVLRDSDHLVDELFAADVLVIGAPIYNFSVPASLKAWIDLVTRARKTFRYTEDGPEGLLKGKVAYLVITSGGTAVDGPLDHATGYLRHVLGFVGITDVTVIAADELMSHADARLDQARERIASIAREL